MLRRTKIRLKRIAIRAGWYVGVPLALCLAARLLWGAQTTGRFATAKREIAAAGVDLDQPLRNVEPDASDREFARELSRACAKIDWKSSDAMLLSEGDSRGSDVVAWNNLHKPMVREVLSKQQAAFDALDNLMQSKRLPDGRLFEKVEDRRMAVLLRDDAILLRDDHEDAKALHRLMQVDFLARVRDQSASEGDHEIAIGLHNLASQGLGQICLGVRLAEGDGSMAEAKELLRNLQDLDAFRKGLSHGYEERVQRIGQVLKDNFPGIDAWWIRPLFEGKMAENLSLGRAIVEASHADNWPAAEKPLAAANRRALANKSEGLLWGEIHNRVISTSDYRVEQHFECMSDTDGTVMLLAAQIYREEQGHYPQNPGELVPGILAVIPIDPFSSKHEPIQYRLDKDGPTVWSIGWDEMDGGGIVAFGATGLRKGRSSQNDRVYGTAWNDAAPPLKVASQGKATTTRGK